MHGHSNIKFVMSVRPSVCPPGTTRLPLNGFSLNLIFEYFFGKKNFREISGFIKFDIRLFFEKKTSEKIQILLNLIFEYFSKKNFRENSGFIKFDIRVFLEKTSEKIQFSLNLIFEYFIKKLPRKFRFY